MAGSLVVVLAWVAFDIPLHYGALAVFLTFLLALVAGRASGETDITPSDRWARSCSSRTAR